MGLNETPQGERIHIAVFGKRNAGKSSLINAMTGQELAIVSDVAGTTTDPVYKSMELLPLGPVVMIDTPGLDDQGELGSLRVKKALAVLNKTDIAVLVTEAAAYLEENVEEAFSFENQIRERIRRKNITLVEVVNKMDGQAKAEAVIRSVNPEAVRVSAKTGTGIHDLKERIAKQVPEENTRPLVEDLVRPMDIVVLVVPVDKAAPKGRLILPQQQTIRALLDRGAVSVVVKDTDLKEALLKLGTKPELVITDSQVFAEVSEQTPSDIRLTSFSILFARYKGELEALVRGAAAIKGLKDGDAVLIAEGCTHHRQCDDIGTVKIPAWLSDFSGRRLNFTTASGTGFPEDLSKYALIVHCGGCMLNQREMKYRIENAGDQGVPIVNYGVLIAYIKGILSRSLEPFPAVAEILKNF